MIRGKDEARVIECASQAAALLKSAVDAGKNQVLGPSPAPYERIAANYRWQIVIKSRLMNSVRAALRQLQPLAGTYCEIDVDPVDLL